MRSRQKFRCVEVIRCNGKIFTSLSVVDVRMMEQQPDLRFWKVIIEKSRNALLRTLSVSAGRRPQLLTTRSWSMGDANQVEIKRVVERT